MRDEDGEQEADGFTNDARMILKRPQNKLVAPLAQRMALFEELPPVLQMRGEEIHAAPERLADVARQIVEALHDFLRVAEAQQLLFHALHKFLRQRDVLEIELKRKTTEKGERRRENEQHGKD